MSKLSTYTCTFCGRRELECVCKVVAPMDKYEDLVKRLNLAFDALWAWRAALLQKGHTDTQVDYISAVIRELEPLRPAIRTLQTERDQDRMDWRELADDLLEDLELHGLHDDPSWHYRRQKAEFKRLDTASSSNSDHLA